MMRYTRSLLGLLIFLAISAEGLAGIWTTNEFIYKPAQGARGEREKSTYDSGLDRVDARLAKEVWVGDPKFGATLQTALTTLGATTAVLRVPKGTCNLDTNLTIPPNITLKPERGAIFAIADAKTLTVNGGLEAGLYQIFSCAGTGKVVFAAGSNLTIVPQWWGASPDASAAVNTAAIQASFNAIANNTSWTLPPGTYTCNAPLVLGTRTWLGLQEIDMDFKGKLLFDACDGLNIRGVVFSNLRGINVERITRTWPDSPANFGIKFDMCYNDRVEIKAIKYFTYGFYLDGDSSGHFNALMNFHLGYITGNQYGQYVTGSGGGWNNENNYYGGFFIGSQESGKTTFQYWAGSDVNTTNNTITFPSYVDLWPTGTAVGLAQGNGGAIAAPLQPATKYYLIRVNAYTAKLATSYANAMAGTAIDLTTQGGAGSLSLADNWAVFFTGDTPHFDNHRWYGPDFEALSNGCNFGGAAASMTMYLHAPRFEMVGNCIEAAPQNLWWQMGTTPMSRWDMAVLCPRMNSYVDYYTQSNVQILGGASWGYAAYAPFTTQRDTGGFGFFNPNDLRQTTNLRFVTKDRFTVLMEEFIQDASGGGIVYEAGVKGYPLNKGYEGGAGPTSGSQDGPMTYAKNSIVWNTTVASGNPMGWVCSKSGSTPAWPTHSITGTGDVTGTTLTITTRGQTQYLFVGAFLKINGVQHQLKSNPVPDSGGAGAVWTLYANNLGGDVTGATLADDPPTWVPMANFP